MITDRPAPKLRPAFPACPSAGAADLTRRAVLGRIGLAAAAAVAGAWTLGARRTLAQDAAARTSGAKRPNIIFILTDDQRWDAMSCMGHPIVKTPNLDRLRNEGVLFKNAFVTTSLCSPSRASFLTGAYAHTHGVVGNWGCEFDHDAMPSFPRLLQQSGYETAYVGKWHMAKSAKPRPGFDYWLSFEGQGVYTNPVLNENGRDFEAQGYITDLLTDHAINFINRDRNKPYCLCLCHKAVHSPFDPAPRDKDSYADAKLPKTPNMQDTFAGKPEWLRGGPAVPSTQDADKPVPDSVEPTQWDPTGVRRMGYLRTLNAVDDGIGRLLKTLEARGELDQTLIIFTSDNGYFFGEHGKGDKRLMYEESIRIPMLMRYPERIKPGTSVESMVLNIDVAPTILDLAGLQPAPTMQGRSVLPLLAGRNEGWRTSFLYEYWVDLSDRIPHMLGVRTDDWKLITYPDLNDIDEMYDLSTDRYEMTNLAANPAFADKHRQLKAELARLMDETGYGARPIPRPPIRGRRSRDRDKK